ncbi:MAG TPA: DUF3300 domain-containing protein [Candidatus Methylomirabilis sp.]|nr:DUF3300 domain-containing protein [Candidatus Methylomirabilis sp.]
MNLSRVPICVLATTLLLLLAPSPGGAQETSAPPVPASAAAAAKTFSQEELDQILAPIALYPDALLAQILMASTYPLEVVQAARWVKENPNVTSKALEDAMQNQAWDPSVKALTAVPQVLELMSDKLEWTQKLGDAFLAQQKDVMDTVQSLRAKAKAEGNLESSKEQVVKCEPQGGSTICTIESPEPDVIYVPTYNPYVVYGTWWYPYPPYYLYPPHYVYPPHVAFHAGIIVGAAIWGQAHWHGGYVSVHVSHYNSFNRTHIDNPNWKHDVAHRQGVPYKDPAVAQRYNRGVNDQAARSRDEYRGRADSGRAEMQARDRGQPQSRPDASVQANSSGFSGVDHGASTRAASARGSTSRASMSRGGGRGGGRR